MKTIWIGIDDTDSTQGGCTTFVACTIIDRLKDSYALIRYPRLIRLNPNIPWKTRGNGALALEFGLNDKRPLHVGEINGKAVYSAQSGKRDLKTKDIQLIQKIVNDVVESLARVDDKNTNPGVVFLGKQPSFSVYTKTVTKVVSIKETIMLLKKLNAECIGLKNKRGLIGAAAAIAWKPQKDRTFEVIAYRMQEKWGSLRMVDEPSVQNMDKKMVSTFDNYDYNNKHNRIAPNSPCPILFGIRGEQPGDLIAAQALICSEKKYGWLVFESNQGTDDHLQRKKISQIKMFESVIVKGVVREKPWTIRGGHVFFSLLDASGSIPCAAYEPTKEFRRVIRQLIPGDVVEIYGGVREKPLTINIEKMQVIKVVKNIEKTENPLCPKCGKHMKSQGKNQGYRCIRCHTKKKNAVMQEKKRSIQPGFYEVPVCARRHLSKPLQRMKLQQIV